jgi:hypothetical protein
MKRSPSVRVSSSFQRLGNSASSFRVPLSPRQYGPKTLFFFADVSYYLISIKLI